MVDGYRKESITVVGGRREAVKNEVFATAKLIGRCIATAAVLVSIANSHALSSSIRADESEDVGCSYY